MVSNTSQNPFSWFYKCAVEIMSPRAAILRYPPFAVAARVVEGYLGDAQGMELEFTRLRKQNRVIKCLIDYCLGIPLFLVSIPVLLFSAICIWITSPHSPFFTQEREGGDGRIIHMIKLRTMYPDAEQLLSEHFTENPSARAEWQRYFKLKNDPRILPYIGTLLRKTSIDELPQLWNVLKGDMSLVGPRPFPVYHLKEFPESFRHLRKTVLPGITGLWQVSARSEGDLSVQERLDTYYIRNWSVWLDFLLLAKTVRAVLSCRGAY